MKPEEAAAVLWDEVKFVQSEELPTGQNYLWLDALCEAIERLEKDAYKDKSNLIPPPRFDKKYIEFVNRHGGE